MSAPDNAEKHVELNPAFERARLASGFLLGLDGEAFEPRDVETSGSGRWITVRLLTWITIRSLLTRGESLPFVHRDLWHGSRYGVLDNAGNGARESAEKL